MRQWVTVLGVLVLLVVSFSLALADSVTLAPSQDTTLYESETGEFSNGAGQYFFAGQDYLGDLKRGLLAFPIAEHIPDQSLITGVTLTLHMSRTIVGPMTVTLHRVVEDWGEGSSDAPGQEGIGVPSTAGDATWIHTFFDNDFWSIPGGTFELGASASQSVDQIGFFTWSSPLLVADVQEWLVNPSDNFGWIVLCSEDVLPSAKRFDTRENPNEDFRPTLTVEFIPDGVPTEQKSWGRIKNLFR